MPGLMAIISADADPMKRELAAAQRMAQQAGAAIRSNMEGGGGHGGQSGIIRETLVMMREISAGNWTRVPGSFSILLQRLGVLNLITKDSASSAKILAEAWELQSAKASMASLAAVRKAAASQAALYAEDGEAEATLAAAVADEEKAAAAILNAKATQAKAVAAREAAEMEALSGTAAVASVGVLGTILSVLVGIAIAAALVISRTRFLASALEGLKMPDFNPAYIAKHLQSVNAAAEGQKEINKEVLKTIELYDSAAKRAERVSHATKEHFEHLRKMNEYQKDPQVKARREQQINSDERAAELANLVAEKNALEQEAQNKKKAADGILVSSKAQESQNVSKLEGDANAAKKFLKEREQFGGWGDRATATYGGGVQAQAAFEAMQKAQAEKVKDAAAAIKAHEDAVNREAANDEIRERKKTLTEQAKSAAARAAELGRVIPDKENEFNQANSDEAEESRAKLNAEKNKNVHGKVNSLQAVGAFASPSSSEILNVAHKQLHHLQSIDQKFGASKGIARSSSHGTKF